MKREESDAAGEIKILGLHAGKSFILLHAWPSKSHLMNVGGGEHD